MTTLTNKTLATACLAAGILLASPRAEASGGLESPSAGVDQMSRGGAWLARADNALAAYFNPAALVTQPHNVHLGMQLLFRSHCFTRVGEDGAPVSPGNDLNPAVDEVCGDYLPLPNPQLAANFRLHKRVAIGLAIVAPHGSSVAEWPETVTYANRFGVDAEHPAPQRYMLLNSEAIALFPTLSVGVALSKKISIGAGFTWGIAAVEFANMAEAVSPVRGTPQPDDFGADIRAQVSGVDGFVPGGVVSVQASPHSRLDIAAWYRISDAIRMNVDLYAQAGYYKENGQVNDQAINDPANITDVGDAGTFELPIPMEAKLALRYHHPRRGARPQAWLRRWGGWGRDSITQDIFDIEANFTWAHNAMVDNVAIRMNPNININGTPGTVPENADQPRNWDHVFGVRLGGEWVPIPDFLALRLGGFFESRGVDAENLNLDFHLAERVGVGGGATIRLGAVDLSLAYQHTFFGELDNGGAGKVKTLSGDASTGDFRTRQPVNGGSARMSLNELGLSGSVRF